MRIDHAAKEAVAGRDRKQSKAESGVAARALPRRSVLLLTKAAQGVAKDQQLGERQTTYFQPPLLLHPDVKALLRLMIIITTCEPSCVVLNASLTLKVCPSRRGWSRRGASRSSKACSR